MSNEKIAKKVAYKAKKKSETFLEKLEKSKREKSGKNIAIKTAGKFSVNTKRSETKNLDN